MRRWRWPPAWLLRMTVGRQALLLTTAVADAGLQLFDAHLPGDLAIAFPVGGFAGEKRVVRSRLDLPGVVDGARGDRRIHPAAVYPNRRSRTSR